MNVEEFSIQVGPRGHLVFWDPRDRTWHYVDDGEPVDWHHNRPCADCGLLPTEDGHDPCLGTLPGVSAACCGHGGRKQAYILFENGAIVRGFDRVEEQGKRFAKMDAHVPLTPLTLAERIAAQRTCPSCRLLRAVTSGAIASCSRHSFAMWILEGQPGAVT